MTLRVGPVLKRAGQLVTSRSGVQLMVLYACYAIIYQIGANGLIAAGIRSVGLPDAAAPPTLVPGSIAVYAGLTVVGLALGLFVTLVGLRTLVARERRSIPRWAVTRRPIWGMTNIFVAGILITIILALGFVLLIIPEIIAYITFIFAVVFVADEDVNAVTGLKRSWRLSRGHWLRIGLVLLIVIGLATVIGAVTSLVTTFGANAIGIGPGVVSIATIVVISPVSIYILAVLTEMYNQLNTGDTISDEVVQL